MAFIIEKTTYGLQAWNFSGIYGCRRSRDTLWIQAGFLCLFLSSLSASVTGRLSLHGKVKYLLSVPESHLRIRNPSRKKLSFYSSIIPAKFLRLKLTCCAKEKETMEKNTRETNSSPFLPGCLMFLIPIYNVWVLSWHQQKFSSTSWKSWEFHSILTLPIWRWHQISQVKDSIWQDCPRPAPHFRSQLCVQVVTCASERPAIDWRVQCPLLGFD